MNANPVLGLRPLSPKTFYGTNLAPQFLASGPVSVHDLAHPPDYGTSSLRDELADFGLGLRLVFAYFCLTYS